MNAVKTRGRGVCELNCSLKNLKDLQYFKPEKLSTDAKERCSSACVQLYVSADKYRKCGKMIISHSQRIPFSQLSKELEDYIDNQSVCSDDKEESVWSDFSEDSQDEQRSCELWLSFRSFFEKSFADSHQYGKFNFMIHQLTEILGD